MRKKLQPKREKQRNLGPKIKKNSVLNEKVSHKIKKIATKGKS